jgi:copper chaperone CopZ
LNKRILVPLALLVLAALTLTACGGGGSSSAEAEITEAIEKSATSADPSDCTETETLSFVEQNSAEKGKAALKTCEEEAEAGEEQAKKANVSNISVNGEKATAEVEFEGGSLDSQTLEVALVEEGGKWKLDQVEGFADYNGEALEKAFEEGFEKESHGLSPELVKCIAQGFGKASKQEAEELLFSGSPEKIEELTEGCAS